MRWTIVRTLFMVLVLTSLVTLALNAVFSQWRFQRDFLAYTGELDAQILDELAPAFADYYTRTQTWSDLHEDSREWHRLLMLDGPRRGARPPRGAPARDARPHGPPPGPPPGGGRNPGAGDPFELGGRVGLYSAAGHHLLGAEIGAGKGNTESIRSGDAVVGQLRLAPPVRLSNELDQRFAAGQRQSLIFVALAVLALAVLVAWRLARRLSRPIGELAARASAMTAGDYTPRLEAVGSGEIADLAADLNRLALTLESNRRSRRQWISDISHELRTPLAIMLAELQALEDGVRQYDDTTRVSLQFEAHRLNRLVHDLSELSASDEGRLSMHTETLNLVPVLAERLDNARHRLADKGLELHANLDQCHAVVAADAARLGQLFDNLIENSLRYTDAPGQLSVSVSCDSDAATIAFEDSAPGVPDELHTRIFDRLFRVDASRSRQSGGSGLGLSICRAIVDAHGGSITAAASPHGGLSIRISLPLHDVRRPCDD